MMTLNKPKTLRIEVTKEDIERGIPKMSTCCAVATAMLRQFPFLTGVSVTGDRLSIQTKDEYEDIHDANCLVGSGALKDFIAAYDTGRPTEPSVFELEVRVEKFAKILKLT